jgi:hypothetical protein
LKRGDPEFRRRAFAKKERLAINLKENSYIYGMVPGNRLNINLKT